MFVRRASGVVSLLLVIACVPSESVPTDTSEAATTAPTTTEASTTTNSPSSTTTTIDPTTLLERLFGDHLPQRVVIVMPASFEVWIWEDGENQTVDHAIAGLAFQVEGDVMAVAATEESTKGSLVDLYDPEITYPTECPRLMTRGDEILALNQCSTDQWSLVEVISGEVRETPIPLESRQDGEYVWFAERGGTVVTGLGDAEGNLTQMTTLDGLDLLGDGYAGLTVLSTDGKYLAYVDHADPAAESHFWSPVVVVVDTGTAEEVGRWTLDNPVLCLEFAKTWVVACEVDDSMNLEPGQQALVAIDVESGEVNRVETRARVFLPAS